MKSTFFYGVIMSAALAVANVGFAAQDPTLHEVYQAAEAGKFTEAQSMMDKVLLDHPNSGKAHFVEAELLAKQGRLENAKIELDTAERLAPGLPFAKPQSVHNLKNRITTLHGTVNAVPKAYETQSPYVQPTLSRPTQGIPWTFILLFAAIAGGIFLFIRAMNRPKFSPSTGMGTGFGNPGTYPAQNGPTAGMAPPMGPVGGTGIGSGILGGLATGAALGVGMVAGEELMHHFTDGNRHDVTPAPLPRTDYLQADDMGGADFGIADNSSWDDNSSGSDDNWDS